MSSRALRRAQKELEERQQLEQLAQDEEESEEEIAPAPLQKPSLFAMLGDANGDHEDDDEADPDLDAVNEAEEEEAPAPKPAKKSKKKKKKGKGKAQVETPERSSASSKAKSGMDEIDRALQALNMAPQSKAEAESDQQTPGISEELQQLYSAIAVDAQHLQAANEMRKLFGRAAVQGGNEDEPRARQRGRGQQQVGLAAAVAGRNAPGRNLASLGLRRNIFVQGKEEWPRATSGGLGMEVVEKRADGTVEYRFVHNTTYQSVQREFETCVASMDPDRMVQLLHFNPYHISTLLQVSEIAKQQRDNATASDLLERALFSFGRAVHSTFSNNLVQGKARLDFRRPENREFWLAVWRYVATLGVRATWRTAFEWAKLLVSLAPEEDPYCVRLSIDQLALRGREPQALVDLVQTDHLERVWKIPPNLAFSVALAHDRLKNPEKARSTLRSAIQEYPWIAARLCRELELAPIPKAIWGKEPSGQFQELLCQLYVPSAKDLWNTPEATSLLMEVASSLENVGAGDAPYWLAPIDEVDLARYVILSDDKSLLSLLDPRVKNKYTSMSDPLPPEDNLPSYTLRTSGRISDHHVDQNTTEGQLLAELETLREYFQRVDLGHRIPNANEQGMTEQQLLGLLEESGTNLNEFRRNTERVQALRVRLQEFGLRLAFERPPDDSDSESDD
ncbi:transcriptional repressor TCF25-domain-containing protein [Lophiotrema nucula]|uniref:Transcriptional repressor TCF25-domain-containing protein n=1 Tax=Lophiotrema nucula TaxID=690887 RepID=A0A6A5YPT3_9PLEO|nr:transcriptional repressor TCF25-domain-containing protein [Lophiotrema nucula]